MEGFVKLENDLHEFLPLPLRKFKVTYWMTDDPEKAVQHNDYTKGGVEFVLTTNPNEVPAVAFRRCKEPSKIWRLTVKEIH